jgi:putative transposase
MVRHLHSLGFKMSLISKTLKLSRTYGYSLLRELPTERSNEIPDLDLRKEIRLLCQQFPTYGYRRITALLRRKQAWSTVNRKRVARLMSEESLQQRSIIKPARRKKSWGCIEVSKSNEHFQVDMTKVWCGKDGWGYLFAVIDAYDREIVGYKFSRWCRTQELLDAVNQAFNYRFPRGVEGYDLRLRSDNGCQMTSRRFVKALQDCGVIHERTGYNNPDSNAYIERWFRTLKEECVWLKEYSSLDEAKSDIKHFIQFYNEERVHSQLDYHSPAQFRQITTSKVA